MRAGLVPAASRLHMLCADGNRKWVSVTPMVVTGILQDAPLLMHVFDSNSESEEAKTAPNILREALAASGRSGHLRQSGDRRTAGECSFLTRREQEVLRLVAIGRDTSQIAEEMGISRHTVRNHIRNLRQKLDASTKLDAVVTGIRLGILPISRLTQ